MSSSTSSITIWKSTAIIIAATALGKLMGFLREIVIAARFGATADTDSYLISFMLPSMIFVGVGAAITIVFMPVFVDCLTKRGTDDAFLLANTFGSLCLILSFVLVVFGIIAAPQLVFLLAPGFSDSIALKTAQLIRILFPSIMLMCVSGIFSAILHALRHFTSPALVSVVFNLVIILAAIGTSRYFGVYGLAIGTLVATGGQVLIQWPFLRKRGFKLGLSKIVFDKDMKQIGRLLPPVLISTSASQINLVVDRILASNLTEGSISFLNFAARVVWMPFGLIVNSLMTVVYPELVDYEARGSDKEFVETLFVTLRVIIVIIGPLATILLIMRYPIIQ